MRDENVVLEGWDRKREERGGGNGDGWFRGG